MKVIANKRDRACIRGQRKLGIDVQVRNRHVAILILLLTVFLAACVPTNADDAKRQAEVAERGAEVMPFDLEQTMHVFTPQDNGGLQKVALKDDGATEQIELIRIHLQEEAERFQEGDFADPAQIHGHEMPGLAELRAHDGRIEIRYSELPDGAQIEYITEDEGLIDAIHHWFKAQLMDHGSHAQQQ